MRVALYIRVSTDEQTDGFSLDAQERAGRLYAELRGWQVAAVYKDDGFSGRSSERPALSQLSADIKAKRVQGVIIHKLDRLARNLQLLLALIGEWDQAGCTFVSISEQMDFSTPMGRMVLQILGAVAEWYSNNLANETRKGMAEKQRQGGWLGPVPYGYRMVDGRLQVDPDERGIVLEIYQRYATGLQSYGQIAASLNARGHTITNWRRTERHPFGQPAVRSILGTRAYLGLITVAGTDSPGTHEAIITPELWERVEAAKLSRAARGRVARFAPTSLSPLHGLIRCAQCGSVMHWSPRKDQYGYYRCSGVRSMVCQAPKMASWRTLAAQIEEQLEGLAIPAELHAEIIRLVAADLEPTQQPKTSSEALQERRKRLARVYADGYISQQDYESEIAELNAQLAVLPEPPPVVSAADIAAAVGWLAQLPRLYAVANTAERAQLLQELFAVLWVEEGRLIAITPRPLYLAVSGRYVRIATPGRGRVAIPQILPVWSHQRQPIAV